MMVYSTLSAQIHLLKSSILSVLKYTLFSQCFAQDHLPKVERKQGPMRREPGKDKYNSVCLINQLVNF